MTRVTARLRGDIQIRKSLCHKTLRYRNGGEVGIVRLLRRLTHDEYEYLGVVSRRYAYKRRIGIRTVRSRIRIDLARRSRLPSYPVALYSAGAAAVVFNLVIHDVEHFIRRFLGYNLTLYLRGICNDDISVSH